MGGSINGSRIVLSPEQQEAGRLANIARQDQKSVEELTQEINRIKGFLDTNPNATEVPRGVQWGDDSRDGRHFTTPIASVQTELQGLEDSLARRTGITSGTPTAPTLAPNPGINAPAIPSAPGGLNSLPSAPTTATSPQGGIMGTVDENRLLAEAELQKSLSYQTLQAQKTARTQYLSDLSSLLQQQQAQQLTTELPGMYEDLNTRGLLRSSALGNELGRRQSELAAKTSGELARQGLAYSDEFTTGLGGIQNSYLQGRNSAIQRAFSISDYQRQLQASKELGFALQPAPQQSSGKGSAMPVAGAGLAGQIGSAAITAGK